MFESPTLPNNIMERRVFFFRSILGFCVLSPMSIVIGSSMPQHIVRPTRRIVDYNPPSTSQHSDDDNLHTYVSHDARNFGVESGVVEDINLHQLVLDENGMDSFWHIFVDAARASESVDAAFEYLKHRGSIYNDKRINPKEKSSPTKTQYTWLRSTTEKHRTYRQSIISFVRKLLSFNNSSESLSSDNRSDSFVKLNDESVDHGTETLQSPDKRSPGYNVSTETEYNVSGTVEIGRSGSDNKTSNDTSIVIYTKAEPCNSIVGTNTSEDAINLDCNATDKSFEIDLSANVTNATSSEVGSIELSKFRPIRIRAILSDLGGGGQHLSEDQRVILLNDMLRPALLAWSAALRVKPVNGNLTVDASQLNDGNTCGPDSDELPNVAVPIEHTTLGVADTDLIIYVGLSFTQNDTANGKNSSYTNTSSEEYNATIKTAFYEDLAVGNSNSTQEFKYIQPKQTCAGDYVAASTFCSTDQFDRPTAALLHICIDEAFFDPSYLSSNVRVMMHELGHALGFNSVSMAHFRRFDGTPITKRDADGSIPLTKIKCTGPVTQALQQSLVALPSQEILKFRTVRNGIRAAEIVTPNVLQVVRNHFDCQEALGAELESGEFLPLSASPNNVSCLGDHWERRLFQSDLMNPLVEMENHEANPFFSTLTLAFFADSGWYQVDLSRADYPSSWGRGAGCDFVEQPCVSEDGKVLPSAQPFFCTQKPSDTSSVDETFSSEIQGCTSDLSRKASCSLGKYAGELPREYQYFKNEYGAEFGGSDPFMDYCPVYAGFSNGLCSDSSSEALIRVSSIERFGRRDSRCLSSQVKVKQESSTSNYDIQVGTTALCLPIACVVEDHSLRIQVNGNWQVCSGNGQILTVTIGNEVVDITCPDPIRVCPTFYCQRDCLGRSDGRTVCNYTVGDCICTTANSTENNTTSACNPMAGDAEDSPGMNQTTEEDTTTAETGMFLNTNQLKNELPDPQSPLADYYVPTARNLREEQSGFFEENWIWFLVGSIALILAVSVCVLVYRRKKRLVLLQNDHGNENDLPEVDFPNPDKDKMMASIVVNLRMNDPALQHRAQLDAILNRESETDLSMTDTEASHVENSSCTVSSQDNDDENDEFVVSDVPDALGSIDYKNYGADQLDEKAAQPSVRRRHTLMNS